MDIPDLGQQLRTRLSATSFRISLRQPEEQPLRLKLQRPLGGSPPARKALLALEAPEPKHQLRLLGPLPRLYLRD